MSIVRNGVDVGKLAETVKAITEDPKKAQVKIYGQYQMGQWSMF
jgi:hypothetical protein